MADITAVLDQGKIVEFGPSEAIYARFKMGYTRDLIAAAPFADLDSICQRQAHREAAPAKRRNTWREH